MCVCGVGAGRAPASMSEAQNIQKGNSVHAAEEILFSRYWETTPLASKLELSGRRGIEMHFDDGIAKRNFLHQVIKPYCHCTVLIKDHTVINPLTLQTTYLL